MTLPGGVIVDYRSSSDIRWSYTNLHGDVVAEANNAGAKVGVTRHYDAYGEITNDSLIDNQPGAWEFGWHGGARRPQENQFGLVFQPIQMGARTYFPKIGRFTEIDPIEGGGSNDYSYPFDPINMSDLDGRCWGPARNLPGCGTGRRVLARVSKIDYGTLAAGAFNMGYGGIRARAGFAGLAASPTCGPWAPMCVTIAAPAAVFGSLRFVRGGRQVFRVVRDPGCGNKCSVGDNARRFIRGVLPAGEGDWLDRLGGF